MELSEKIQNLRKERGLTQEQFANQLFVSRTAVSKWETGAGFPDVQTIPDIAHALDTTTDYLFGRVKKQHKVLCYNIQEGDGTPANGRNYRRKYEAELNDKYLTQGWHIVNSALSSETEFTYMMVVVERED